MEIGKTVEWTSQAGGHAKTKIGTIVTAIAPGSRPANGDFAGLYPAKLGGPRVEESYIVKVGDKHYWPRTSLLKPATAETTH